MNIFKELATGRRTQRKGEDSSYESMSMFRSYDRGCPVSNAERIIHDLNAMNTSEEKLKYLRKVSPEISMAIWSFMRLSNQGGDLEFTNKDGSINEELKKEWRYFAERIGEGNNLGLDGVINQLHYSYFVLGAMACEVEVNKDRNDIVDVYVVSPESIFFKNEKVDGRFMDVPYQSTTKGDVCLGKGKANFYWIPQDPEPEESEGVLALETSIYPAVFQFEIQRSIAKVLEHQGFPKYDITVDIQKLVDSMPAEIRNDYTKMRKIIAGEINNVASSFRSLDADSDIVHTDEYTVKVVGGADQARSIDVRAINDMVGNLVTNGAKTLGTFINKTAGKTETWSTVEFSIMINYIKSCQKASKRMVENIARLWLRTKGVQASVKYTHKSIDYKSDTEREELRAKRLQNAREYIELGFMTEEEARAYALKE